MTRLRIIGPVVTVIALAAASCGGSAEEAGSPEKAPIADEERSVSETTTTTEAATTTTEATTTTLPDPHADIRPEFELSPISAGPISLTPTLCDTGNYDYVTSSGPDVLGVVGDTLFTEVNGQAKAFTLDLSDGCSITENPDLGTDGYVGEEGDSLLSIETGENGNVLITHFGESMVINANTGLSYACDDIRLNSVLNHEGDWAFDWWPGTDDNSTFDLSDTRCVEGDLLQIPGNPGQVRGGFTMNKEYLGMGLLLKEGEESWSAAALFDQEGLVWMIDDQALDSPYYLGQLDGMVRCGDNTCINQEFSDEIYVIDDSGELLAELTTKDMSGGEGGLKYITADPEGNLYGIISIYVSIEPAPDAAEDDPDPSLYFNYVVRLDATS